MKFIKYDTSDLKKMENQIVDDIVNGRLHFIKWKIPTFVSTDIHYQSINAFVKIRVDHANIGGTFSFIWVQGTDVSSKRVEEFDHERVIEAVRTKKDPGVTKTFSLWRC